MKKRIGNFLEDFFCHKIYPLVLIWAVFIFVAINFAVYVKLTWHNSVNNPVNEPYVVEAAFNLGIAPDEVTQAQFDARYR